MLHFKQAAQAILLAKQNMMVVANGAERSGIAWRTQRPLKAMKAKAKPKVSLEYRFMAGSSG